MSSRKAHSFLCEYPRIRVDRFTESRERIPRHLRRSEAGHLGSEKGADEESWQDLEADGQPAPEFFPHPTVQLLTHIHLDHLEGLNTPLHNASPIYCSRQTKEMLLRLELGPSRAAGLEGVAMGSRGRKRPYEWLRVAQREAKTRRQQTGAHIAPRDILHPLPLNTPTEIDYLPGVRVRITLLDANHMPGAVMFLVEGHRGAVLHTGDCRAEKWWLEALVRNPAMQRYTSWEEARAIASREEVDDDPLLRSQAEQIESTQRTTQSTQASATFSQTPRSDATGSMDTSLDTSRDGPRPTVNRDLRLRNIYIDDEGIHAPHWPLAKKDAVLDLVRLMERYPKDTNFFFDMWTWGYEEIYLAIGKSFQCKGKGHRVHVDRYKADMYRAADDAVAPFLTTRTSSRFHACERKGECEYLCLDERLAGERDAFESLSQHWTGPAPMPAAASESHPAPKPSGPLTVYVKPVGFSKRKWKEVSSKLHAELDQATRGEGSYPLWLACPIERHSTLPELQRLVRAFRPATVTPTTAQPDHYFLVARYLGPALAPGGQARIDEDAKDIVGPKHWAKYQRLLASDRTLASGETVAAELQRFHEGLRQTLDLSQSWPDKANQAAEAGYEADCSGVATAVPARLAPTAALSGTDTGANSSHAGTAGPAAGPKNAAPPIDDTSFVSAAPPEAAGSATVLDEDLARRYFIVLRMFIEPGLRLKNLPGNTEGPQAWRAVRRLRPDYARRTEDTMHREVGVIPPPWSTVPSVRSSAAPSPAPTPPPGSGEVPVNTHNLAPNQILRIEAKKAVEVEMAKVRGTVTDAGLLGPEAETSVAPDETGTAPAVPQNEPHGGATRLFGSETADVAAAPSTTAVGELADPELAAQGQCADIITDFDLEGDYDWLGPLLQHVEEHPLPAGSEPTAGAIAARTGASPSTSTPLEEALELHTKVYREILARSIAFANAPWVLARYSLALGALVGKALGRWSLSLSLLGSSARGPAAGTTLIALTALWQHTEAACHVAAVLLAPRGSGLHRARPQFPAARTAAATHAPLSGFTVMAIDDGARSRLLTAISSTHDLSVAFERSEQPRTCARRLSEGGAAALAAGGTTVAAGTEGGDDVARYEETIRTWTRRVIASLVFAREEDHRERLDVVYDSGLEDEDEGERQVHPPGAHEAASSESGSGTDSPAGGEQGFRRASAASKAKRRRESTRTDAGDDVSTQGNDDEGESRTRRRTRLRGIPEPSRRYLQIRF